MSHLAVVVPRYGEPIVGGAEVLARRVAGLLAHSHRVTVLTTTASDYRTWHNDLPAGESTDGAVRVLRFPVLRPRGEYWKVLNGLLHDALPPWELSTMTAGCKRALRWQLDRWPQGLQEEYVRWQGPDAPALPAWLTRHAAGIDRVLFFTYLYPTTYFGMRCVSPGKIDLYPTLHDEPVAYLPVFSQCFRGADRILFSTAEEFRVAQRLYGELSGTAHVVGSGIPEPAEGSAGVARAEPFVLYVGRIDPAKGVTGLMRDFARWKDEQPGSALRLVLIGDRLEEGPEHPAIEYRGRVSEADKIALMRQARALVQPSSFESLALVVLEAFWCGTPALVFGGNEVLVGHCRRANGGLWYHDYAELAEALAWFEAHPDEARALGAQGRDYVRRTYSLDAYAARLAALYPRDDRPFSP